MTRANKQTNAQWGKKNNGGSGGGTTLGTRKGNQMTNPGSRNIITKTGVPRIRNTAEGCIVSNQEMYGIISGSASAGTNSLAAISMNPCDNGVFFWLSHIAQRYSMYRMKKLKVHLSSLLPTTALGAVTIGGFYDREDLLAWIGAPSVTGLSQTKGSSTGPVWSTTLHRGANGQITSDVSFEFDCRLAHARTPWFRMDKVPGSDAEYNQAMGCHTGILIGFTGLANQDAIQCWFEYEIELLHPAPTSANSSLMMEGPNPSTIHVNRPDVDRRVGVPAEPLPSPSPNPPKPPEPLSQA